MAMKERCINLNNKYFYINEQISDDISKIIGNKSYNTFLLNSKGFAVPKSIFTTPLLFDCYKNNILEFNKEITNIQNYLRENHFSNSLAVRSSCLLFDESGNVIKEDSDSLSMAGWFKSNLNISINSIRSAIVDCYSIVNSETLRQNINNHFHSKIIVKVALLIQEFYTAEKSAVIFTKNQYAYKRGDFLINSTYGACNGLVSGEITGDSYWINRKNGSVNFTHITKKDKMYVNSIQGIDIIDVATNLQNKETLSNKDIKNLFKLGMSVEKAFNCPQDMELIYNLKDGWIIVQTRPIVYWKGVVKDE